MPFLADAPAKTGFIPDEAPKAEFIPDTAPPKTLFKQWRDKSRVSEIVPPKILDLAEKVYDRNVSYPGYLSRRLYQTGVESVSGALQFPFQAVKEKLEKPTKPNIFGTIRGIVKGTKFLEDSINNYLATPPAQKYIQENVLPKLNDTIEALDLSRYKVTGVPGIKAVTQARGERFEKAYGPWGMVVHNVHETAIDFTGLILQLALLKKVPLGKGKTIGTLLKPSPAYARAAGLIKEVGTARKGLGAAKTLGDISSKLFYKEIGKHASFMGLHGLITTQGSMKDRLASAFWRATYNLTPALTAFTTKALPVDKIPLFMSKLTPKFIDFFYNSAITTPQYVQMYKETGGFNPQFWQGALPQVFMDAAMSIYTQNLPMKERERTLYKYWNKGRLAGFEKPWSEFKKQNDHYAAAVNSVAEQVLGKDKTKWSREPSKVTPMEESIAAVTTKIQDGKEVTALDSIKVEAGGKAIRDAKKAIKGMQVRGVGSLDDLPPQIQAHILKEIKGMEDPASMQSTVAKVLGSYQDHIFALRKTREVGTVGKEKYAGKIVYWFRNSSKASDGTDLTADKLAQQLSLAKISPNDSRLVWVSGRWDIGAGRAKGDVIEHYKRTPGESKVSPIKALMDAGKDAIQKEQDGIMEITEQGQQVREELLRGAEFREEPSVFPKTVSTDVLSYDNLATYREQVKSERYIPVRTTRDKTAITNRKEGGIFYNPVAVLGKFEQYRQGKLQFERGVIPLPPGLNRTEFAKFVLEHERAHMLTGLDGSPMDQIIVSMLALERIGRADLSKVMEDKISVELKSGVPGVRPFVEKDVVRKPTRWVDIWIKRWIKRTRGGKYVPTQGEFVSADSRGEGTFRDRQGEPTPSKGGEIVSTGVKSITEKSTKEEYDSFADKLIAENDKLQIGDEIWENGVKQGIVSIISGKERGKGFIVVESAIKPGEVISGKLKTFSMLEGEDIQVIRPSTPSKGGDLIEQAKQYKTAEEFVRANYNTELDDYNIVKDWIQKNTPKQTLSGHGPLKEVSERIRKGDVPKNVLDAMYRVFELTIDRETGERLYWDDPDYPRTGTLMDFGDAYNNLDIIYNKEGLLTKSQLTDIWKEAHPTPSKGGEMVEPPALPKPQDQQQILRQVSEDYLRDLGVEGTETLSERHIANAIYAMTTKEKETLAKRLKGAGYQGEIKIVPAEDVNVEGKSKDWQILDSLGLVKHGEQQEQLGRIVAGEKLYQSELAREWSNAMYSIRDIGKQISDLEGKMEAKLGPKEIWKQIDLLKQELSDLTKEERVLKELREATTEEEREEKRKTYLGAWGPKTDKEYQIRGSTKEIKIKIANLKDVAKERATAQDVLRLEELKESLAWMKNHAKTIKDQYKAGNQPLEELPPDIEEFGFPDIVKAEETPAVGKDGKALQKELTGFKLLLNRAKTYGWKTSMLWHWKGPVEKQLAAEDIRYRKFVKPNAATQQVVGDVFEAKNMQDRFNLIGAGLKDKIIQGMWESTIRHPVYKYMGIQEQQQVVRDKEEIMVRALEETIVNRDAKLNEHSLTETGAGGVYPDLMEAEAVAQDAMRYNKYHNHKLEDLLKERPEKLFFNMLDRPDQHMVEAMQRDIMSPLRDHMVQAGLLNDTQTAMNVMKGFTHRLTRKLKQQQGGPGIVSPWMGSQKIWGQKYRTYSQYRKAAIEQGLVPIERVGDTVSHYMVDYSTRLFNAEKLKQFALIEHPEIKHESDGTEIIGDTNVKSGMKVVEYESRFDAGQLTRAGYRQMHTAPGLSHFWRGATEYPWVHASVYDLLTYIYAGSDVNKALNAWNTLNGAIKRAVMWTPGLSFPQITSSGVLWSSKTANVALKEYIKLLPGLAKSISQTRKGDVSPFENMEGIDPKYQEQYQKYGLNIWDYGSMMHSFWNMTKAEYAEHPLLASGWQQGADFVKNRFGMDRYVFEKAIPKVIYTYTRALHERFKTQGFDDNTAAKMAVAFANDTSGLGKANLMGKAYPLVRAVFFAPMFTGTFIRQVTGALGVQRPFQTRGAGSVFNYFLHGEKTATELRALRPYYVKQLLKVLAAKVLLMNFIQIGLSYLNPDENEHGKTTFDNEKGRTLQVKTPWKTDRGDPIYLDFLIFREASQLVDLIGDVPPFHGRGAGNLFQSKLASTIGIGLEQWANEDYKKQDIALQGAPLGERIKSRTGAFAKGVIPQPFRKDARQIPATAPLQMLGVSPRIGSQIPEYMREPAQKYKYERSKGARDLGMISLEDVVLRYREGKIDMKQLMGEIRKRSAPVQTYFKRNKKAILWGSKLKK